MTFWSDIGCPWATLCLVQLRAAASQRGFDLAIDHRAYPLELLNACPTPKLIIDAEVVVIAGSRPDLGWRPWSAPAETYPVTMLPALEAVQATKSPGIGGLGGSEQLDAALRRAFYVDHRCISLPAVILEVAAGCDQVDEKALGAAIAVGVGRTAVYQDWKLASTASVQGSPHLFTGSGYGQHNPGVSYRWTGMPALPLGYGPQGGAGFPVLDGYDPSWSDSLLNLLR